jgi:hypothetical protein
MGESSLHESIKLAYSRPGDLLEKQVGEYIVDIIHNDLIIEIQTANFSSVRTKLKTLLEDHKIRLVYPISKMKWIIRTGTDGRTELSRRKSPKKGRLEDLFNELVYLPNLLSHSNFSIELLYISSEDVLINDGKGSWRRKYWSVHDRRLLEIADREVFCRPRDFLKLLPSSLPKQFTTRDLSKIKKLPIRLTQKMAYCLRLMNVIKIVSRKKGSNIYEITDQHHPF